MKPFTETYRSLKADNFYPSLVGMVLMIVVLVGWGIWFCIPTIPQYASSTNLTISGGDVTAYFSPEVTRQLRYKQQAYLYIYRDEPVILTIIDADSETGQINLVAESRAGLAPLMGQTGVERLDVIVSYVSPAYLVLQAAGILH